MGKEVFTTKQAISMLVMFEIGSALIHSVHTKDDQDFWINYLIAAALTLFTFFIYSRIMILFPGKDLLDISKLLFGKIVGSVIYFSFVFYAFSLGAFVTRHFTEVIQVSTLPEAPQYAFAISMILVSIYIVKNGIQTFGRWCLFSLPIILTIFLVTVAFSVYLFDFRNLKPVFQSSVMTIADNSFNTYTLPFGESVVFLLLIDSLKKRQDTLKVFYGSLAISMAIIMLAALRNLLILGTENIQLLTSASISGVSVIQITSFVDRIEIIVIVNFIICGIAKIAVCLMGAAKGVARLFKLDSDKQVAVPIGLLMLMLSFNVFKNALQLNEWFDVYRWIFLPAHILFPLVAWVIAEIKTKLQKRKKMKTAEQPD